MTPRLSLKRHRQSLSRFVCDRTTLSLVTICVFLQETSSVPAIDSLPEHAGHLVTQILGAQRELEPQREASTEEVEIIYKYLSNIKLGSF
jgi:hypothetical protein